MVEFDSPRDGGSTSPPPSQTHETYPPRNGGHVVFDMNDTSVAEESAPTQYHTSSFLDGVRHKIARFGRLTGMHFPGISYSVLRNEHDGSSGSRAGRRVGGGINQDGVFSNMNAKPDGPQRVSNDPNDRGEDDDLADDTLPPTYEAAAADTAPTYWESTVFTGNPLADSEGGWTPESIHVGEPADLIEDGMLLGSIFGFVWNMFVSGSFQFVGFIMTFLLHTTHAAKLGSRAGLGITLAQYSAVLLSRLADAQKTYSHPDKDMHKSHRRVPTPEEFRHSRILCYTMLGFGCFLFLQSVLKYVMMYRKATRLVAEARRNEQAPTGQQDTDSSSVRPTGFLQSLTGINPVASMSGFAGRLRETLFSDFGMVHPAMMRSAEDFIIRPGRGMEPNIVSVPAEDAFAVHLSNFMPGMQRGRGLSDPFPDYMHPTSDDIEAGARRH